MPEPPVKIYCPPRTHREPLAADDDAPVRIYEPRQKRP